MGGNKAKLETCTLTCAEAQFCGTSCIKYFSALQTCTAYRESENPKLYAASKAFRFKSQSKSKVRNKADPPGESCGELAETVCIEMWGLPTHYLHAKRAAACLAAGQTVAPLALTPAAKSTACVENAWNTGDGFAESGCKRYFDAMAACLGVEADDVEAADDE